MSFQHSVKIMHLAVLDREDLLHLSGQHACMSSFAAVTRYVTRTGSSVLLRLAPLDNLRQLREQAYLRGNESVLASFSCPSLDTGGNLQHVQNPVFVSVFGGTYGILSAIATSLGWPATEAVKAALVAGMAQSQEWLPQRSIDRHYLAIQRLTFFLEEKVATLRKIVS